MAYAEYDLGVIGGPQGPKELLDAVRHAITEGNLDTLNRLTREFTSIDANVSKCVDACGNTIVHLALNKDANVLRYVLNNLHGDVNATNAQGRTPLHEAVTRNFTECCELLLAHGANDAVQSATLSTPFHTAAACGSVECMELLLKHSENALAKVNELDKTRSSALHKCAFDGDVRVSEWLVKHGAIVDASNALGLTPLLVAVKMGQCNVVSFLLAHGAHCNRQDGNGNSAAHYCALRNDTAMLSLLLEHGLNVDVQNNELNNPLHLTSLHPRPDSREWEEMIALLLLAGCNPAQENACKKTPTDYVGRNLKKLYAKDEVLRRNALAAKVKEEQQKEHHKAAAEYALRRANAEALVKIALDQEAAENERISRETDERVRAEEDARTMLEELVETLRFQQEEIARKKDALAKLKEKGAGAGKREARIKN